METIQKLNQKELKEKLTAALGEENAKKLLDIAPAILESELDKTIAEFPRLHKKQVIRLFENVANIKKTGEGKFVVADPLVAPHVVLKLPGGGVLHDRDGGNGPVYMFNPGHDACPVHTGKP